MAKTAIYSEFVKFEISHENICDKKHTLNNKYKD